MSCIEQVMAWTIPVEQYLMRLDQVRILVMGWDDYFHCGDLA